MPSLRSSMLSILKADKAAMITLFHKVVPDNEAYNNIFYHGYDDSACYSHLHDWWERYVYKNVKCEVLRESLIDDFECDDECLGILEGIADLLDDKDIQYHKEEKKEESDSEEEEESDSESDSEEEDFEDALKKARATRK